MFHLDTAQCRILKDSGRFLVKIPRGLGLKSFVHVMGTTVYSVGVDSTGRRIQDKTILKIDVLSLRYLSILFSVATL